MNGHKAEMILHDNSRKLCHSLYKVKQRELNFPIFQMFYSILVNNRPGVYKIQKVYL